MFRRHNCTISQINTVLTPNNLPVTNFPIAVVDVTVYQICLSGEDGYLASWLCGIENLSGKLGSLHVRVTPPERSVTVMVNGREYEAAANNLTAISYNDATPNVTFSHDRFGHVTAAVTAGVSSNLYTYSHTRLLTNETITLYSSTPSYEIFRPHDTLGRPVGLILSSLAETQGEGAAPYAVTYNYDEHGRLDSLHASVQSSDITFTYNYLPGSSLLAGVASSLGASFTRAYEPHRDLITAVTNHWNGTLVSSFAYVNDAIGRRTRRLDDGTVTNVFGYNGCSELTGAAMGTNAYSYAYDGIGNRLSTTDNGIGTAYLTNPLNQYTNILRDSSPPCELEYDLDGNLLNLPSPSGRGGGDEGWLCQWDGENRLIAVYSGGALVISDIIMATASTHQC